MGPLAGVAAGLHYARDMDFESVLTCGVDAPNLPENLAELLSPAPAYLADQPVIGHWPTHAASEVETILESEGRHSMRAFAEATSDVQRLADTICEHMTHLVADGCGLALVNEEEESLHPLGIYFCEPRARAAARAVLGARPIALGSDWISARVARSRKPVVYAQVDLDLLAREAARARELAAEGLLARLWTLPGRGRNLGLWQAVEAGRLQEILRALPLADWLTTETVPLTRHPSDPAVAEEPPASTGSAGTPAA